MQNNKILELLKKLVSIDSITGTVKEQKIEKFLDEYLHKMPYFQEHPELAGLSAVPHDPYGRSVVYGLLLGKSKKTVVFINHHDVVDISCYGELQEIACDMEKVTEALQQRELDAEVQADFTSGLWLGGRGSNDMKGGMAAQLVYLEEYAAKLDGGSLMFVSVPDEESFSWGMRHGITLLKELKAKYSLEYRLCVNSEPNRQEEGKQIVPTGSVGKLLPFVVIQGKSTHVSEYAHGLNPVGLLADLVAATEGNPALCESCEGEQTIAPVWMYMRDCKINYDFSLPKRAAGYCSVQTFQKSPAEILELLGRQLQESFSARQQSYTELPELPIIFYQDLRRYVEHLVYFPDWQQQELETLQSKISTQGMSYPDATLCYVEDLLDLLQYQELVAVLGFAPPYYPATNSQLMGKEYFGDIQAALSTVMDVKYEPYFLGVSDCSYCGLTTRDKPEDYSSNTPLWGDLYSFDVQALAELQIPFMLLGPWGKNLHELTERVNVQSLTEELPQALHAVVQAAWK